MFMRNISYKIFIQKRGFAITTDIFVWSGILGSLVFMFIVDKYFHEFYVSRSIHKLMIPILTGFLILWILLYIVSFSRTRKLNGHFDGNLVLKKDGITINEIKYSLKDIRSLEFNANDFKGKYVSSTKSINPRCSQGVNNQFKITLNNGSQIVVMFLLEFENQLKESEDEIMYFLKEEKIHSQNVMRVLGINSFSEMQAIKIKHYH